MTRKKDGVLFANPEVSDLPRITCLMDKILFLRFRKGSKVEFGTRDVRGRGPGGVVCVWRGSLAT